MIIFPIYWNSIWSDNEFLANYQHAIANNELQPTETQDKLYKVLYHTSFAR